VRHLSGRAWRGAEKEAEKIAAWQRGRECEVPGVEQVD
jgi:hypothetical protein